jgi:hypothetical protein
MILNTATIITFIVTLNFNVMWVALYILVIRRGNIDKTYGIPLVSLAANFVWDVYNTFWAEYRMPMPQPLIDGVYMVIDMVIIYQVLRYWRSDMGYLKPRTFYLYFVIIFALSFMIMRALIIDLNDKPTWHAAFIDTLLNSALFIGMFYSRPKLEGQSLWIALFKWLGTAPFMLLLYFAPQLGINDLVQVPNTQILPMLWIGIFVLDLIYVVLVYQRSRKLGINPWKRW